MKKLSGLALAVILVIAAAVAACGPKSTVEPTPHPFPLEAQQCQAAFSAAVEEGVPEAPVLMLKQSAWTGEGWNVFTPPWEPAAREEGQPKTLVCILETRLEIEDQTVFAGSQSFHPYQLIWDIRLLQLPGGKVIVAGKYEGRTMILNDNKLVDENGKYAIYCDPPTHELFAPISPTLGKVLLPGHAIENIAFSPDGRFLASSGYPDEENSPLQMWDTTTWESKGTFEDSESADCLAFSPDGKNLATCAPGQIQIWDTRTGELTQKNDLWYYDTDLLAYSPDGKLLIAAYFSDLIYLDANSGEEVRRTKLIGTDIIFSFGFSPDGKLLAVGGRDLLAFYDPATGEEVASLFNDQASDNPGYANLDPVVFSPDGKWLATSGGGVRLWDVSSRKVVHTLEDGLDLAFSADSTLLAQGQLEGEVFIWDVASGEKIGTLRAFSDTIDGLAFSPDGKWLAVGCGKDGGIRLWDVKQYLP